VAIAGVLDHRSFDTPKERAWTFRTVGVGHGPEFWSALLDELRSASFSGVLSIENEDPYDSPSDGVRQAAAFMRPIIDAR
jgi:sugar phosphate isomerase/epimerase